MEVAQNEWVVRYMRRIQDTLPNCPDAWDVEEAKEVWLEARGASSPEEIADQVVEDYSETHDGELQVRIPGASRDVIEKGKQAAERFFQANSLTALAAANAAHKLQSFFDVGEWLFEITDEEHEAAEVWYEAPSVVREVCGVDDAYVELVRSTKTATI